MGNREDAGAAQGLGGGQGGLELRAHRFARQCCGEDFGDMWDSSYGEGGTRSFGRSGTWVQAKGEVGGGGKGLIERGRVVIVGNQLHSVDGFQKDVMQVFEIVCENVTAGQGVGELVSCYRGVFRATEEAEARNEYIQCRC